MASQNRGEASLRPLPPLPPTNSKPQTPERPGIDKKIQPITNEKEATVPTSRPLPALPPTTPPQIKKINSDQKLSSSSDGANFQPKNNNNKVNNTPNTPNTPNSPNSKAPFKTAPKLMKAQSESVGLSIHLNNNQTVEKAKPPPPPPRLNSPRNTQLELPTDSINNTQNNNNNSNNSSKLVNEKLERSSSENSHLSINETHQKTTKSSKSFRRGHHYSRIIEKGSPDEIMNDLEKYLELLKKFGNANKQILAVARSTQNSISNCGKFRDEILKEQLAMAKGNLELSNNAYLLNLKGLSQLAIKTLDHIQKLNREFISLGGNTISVLNALKSITLELEDKVLHKQALTASNTANESFLNIVNYVYENLQFEQDEEDYVRAIKKKMEGIITLLVCSSMSSGKLITYGKILEIEAAVRLIAIAVSKLINAFNSAIKLQIIIDAKVASCSISYLTGSLTELVTNINLLAKPELRQSLVDATSKIKSKLTDFMEQLKKEVSNPNSQSKISLDALYEPFQSSIKELLMIIISHSSIELSELAVTSSTPLTQQQIDRILKLTSFVDDPFSVGAVQLSNQSSSVAVDVQDVNIWKEAPDSDQTIIFTSEQTIRCATLNKLVTALTTAKNHDMNFMKTFITTFRSFTTPQILLKKLIERFHVPSEFEEDAVTIHLRICNVLKNWIENSYDDFNDTLINDVETFLKEVEDTGKYQQYVISIRSVIARKREDNLKLVNPKNEILSLTIESKIIVSPATIIFVFDEEELAKQITLIDFQFYQSIKPDELLDQAWAKPKLKHRAKNVLALVNRSTCFSRWVVSSILWQDTLKGRIRALTKLINIAEHLRKLNNFNSVMAVIAGINTSSVYRLKFTREGIPPQSLEIFSNLEEMMDPVQSYNNYRQRLRTINPPAIPFLGTYLTDITFIDDGNKDDINNLINYRKRELCYNIIRDIQQYQQIGYNFEYVDNIAHFLYELPYIESEQEAYDLSLEREPRNATLDSLA